VEIPPGLAAQLAALTVGLEEDGVGLEAQLRAFGIALKSAVPSYLGMTITVAGHDLRLTMYQDDGAGERGEIISSLLIPLTAIAAFALGSSLVLYAATAGAFVDLAADLCFALGLGLEALVLDTHLLPPSTESELVGVVEMSRVNQAIGILVDLGRSIQDARVELEHRAAMDGTSLAVAAQQLLDEILEPPGAQPG
jgi:hypothetical protein